MDELIKDIVESIYEYQDPERLKFAATSYPTSMKVIGITNPHLKKIIKHLKEVTRSWSHGQRIEIAKQMDADLPLYPDDSIEYEVDSTYLSESFEIEPDICLSDGIGNPAFA